MDAETKKRQLTTRRRKLLASIERAAKFIDDYDAGRDALQVVLRVENLEALWQRLEEVQLELEELEATEEEGVSNEETRSGFEARLFQVKARLIALVPAPVDPPNNLPPNPPATSSLSGIKLPTIALPEFSGDYQDWLNFHDTFSALIHQNAEVADIQKFHYLRAAVKGEAAQVIESITISAANYQLAWESLVSRYSNEYLLKKRHLQALLETPRMKNESASALHLLVDDFERHIKILRQLGEPTDTWSTILEHLLCTRLHDETLKLWEDHASTIERPTYTNMVTFLQRRVRVLESISVNHDSVASISSTRVGSTPSASYQRPGKLFQQNLSTNTAAENSRRQCYACGEYHLLIHCPRFESMTITERLNVISTHRLCQNCFHQNHFARQCPSQFSCRECQERHHTLLHFPSTTRETHSRRENYPVQPPTATLTSATNEESMNAVPTSNSDVFLSTVVLLAVDTHGNTHPVRALLDNGSQSNIMSERLCRMLELKRTRVNIPIHGVGQSSSQAQHTASTRIRSRRNAFEAELNFLVMPSVTINLPTVGIPADEWHTPKEIFMADPTFNHPGPIDMLLGAEHFFRFFNTGIKIEEDHRPTLIDSIFGWVASGRNYPGPPSNTSSCHVLTIDAPQHNVGIPIQQPTLQPRSHSSVRFSASDQRPKPLHGGGHSVGTPIHKKDCLTNQRRAPFIKCGRPQWSRNINGSHQNINQGRLRITPNCDQANSSCLHPLKKDQRFPVDVNTHPSQIDHRWNVQDMESF